MNEAAISRRIDELLELCSPKEKPDWIVQGTAIVQGTMSVMIVVYGQGSSQVSILDETIKKARDARAGHMVGGMQAATKPAHGALLNLKGEIEAGMLGSLQKEISSDVLTDFIQLARKALEDGSEGAKKRSGGTHCRSVRGYHSAYGEGVRRRDGARRSREGHWRIEESWDIESSAVGNSVVISQFS